MHASEPEGSKNLPIPIKPEEPDLVDAEFSQLPDETEFTQLPKPPSRQYWPHVLAACVIAAGIYWLFFSAPSSEVGTATTPAVAGWDQLGSCISVASLDGMRQLSLYGNGGATLSDDTPQKDDTAAKARSVDGYWRFNEGSKRYTVTFKDENTSYLLVTSDRAPVCMLIKGDIGAADLRESWFFSTAVEDDPRDYEMPEPR
jgi:hypothetical protein